MTDADRLAKALDPAHHASEAISAILHERDSRQRFVNWPEADTYRHSPEWIVKTCVPGLLRHDQSLAQRIIAIAEKEDDAMNSNPLDNDFLRGYLECALWTGTDESDEAGGDPLDQNYDVSDFAPESMTKAAAECEAFQEANAADLEAFYVIWPKSPDGNSKEAFAGHNFWLTRNGHGTGFWDRDAAEVGDRLTEACGRSERNVYVGGDGQLWID